MTTLTLTVPLPPNALSPNARVHWRTKAKATKKYRRAVWALAVAAIKGPSPRWLKASVVIKAYHKTIRQRDDDNLTASLKAAFDGLQDAGVIANDNGFRHKSPQFFKDASNPRIELIITEEP